MATPATRRFVVEGQAATLFDAVRARLNEQPNSHKVSRSKSEVLLVGRIFDDRGNRTTPSHARKNGAKYRYYISSLLVQAAARTGQII
jgi:site-specific DNA recombinase